MQLLNQSCILICCTGRLSVLNSITISSWFLVTSSYTRATYYQADQILTLIATAPLDQPENPRNQSTAKKVSADSYNHKAIRQRFLHFQKKSRFRGNIRQTENRLSVPFMIFPAFRPQKRHQSSRRKMGILNIGKPRSFASF